ADAPFATSSGGRKRQTLLARALVRQPDVLLLDEPTNHLDVDAIEWMEQFLIDRGTTLLFVTHDRSFLRRVATRIVELDRGRLVVEARDVSFARGDRVIVRDFTTTITRGDRVGVMGPNGSGKTTLLRLLLGELVPDSGTVRVGTGLEIAYFDQLREQLDPER